MSQNINNKSSGTGDGGNMGDVFKQRRADRQQQQEQQQQERNNNNNNHQNNNKKSSTFLEIQAEQEREQKQYQHKSPQNNSNRGGGQRYNNRGVGGDRNTGYSSQSHSHHTSNNASDEEDRKSGGVGRRQQQRGVRGGGNTRGGGRGGGGGKYSHLPLEQGVICTLKDGFGFIHCADRPEQVFFHYSELRDGLRSTDLKIDDELQFRIGESPSSGGDGDNKKDTSKKIAALHVTRLPLGTSIVWEYPDNTFQYPVRGLVERVARGSDSKTTVGQAEGTIRIITPEAEKNGEAAKTLTADGPLIRYLAGEYNANNKSSTAAVTSSTVSDSDTDGFKQAIHYHPGSSNRSPTTLSRGDLVEISQIVTDRRTKEKYAKNICMIMSERQRHFQEIEAKLLAAATVEHGVITSLKGDYGFLKSNQRHEEVYFHRSSITQITNPDDDNDDSNNKNEPQLKEGQEMKFLVVTEGSGSGANDNSSRKQRVSARQVQLQPSGSVQWHDLLAQGVTGVVIECPQPIDSGHPLETQGKVRLHTPIRMKKKHSLEEEIDREQRRLQKIALNKNVDEEEDTSIHEDDEYILCSEVFIWSKDSPGGNFSYRGGSSVGLYIQNGDTLLFDVIRDYIGEGGTCRAAPTKYLTPREEEQERSHLEADSDIADPSKAIKLIDLALAGRAEGVVNALKDNTYGFIHFAERPVDVHFKMFQLLPDTLQSDLRRNMGLPDSVKLEVGAEVQFDLSVHGTIASHTTKNSNNKKRQQQQQHVHERENLKAQRILLLPPGTIHQTTVLANGVTGKVCKQDNMQPYVGNIELDKPIKAMLPEDRHPLVAKMIEAFLEEKQDTKIIYHDLQSLKEDEVVVKMVETLGNGKLVCSHVPVAGETVYPGLLCIEKVIGQQEVSHTPETMSDDVRGSGNGSGAASHDANSHDRQGLSDDELASSDDLSNDGDPNDVNKENKNKTRKKKHAILKAKTLKTVRFDKTSLSAELRNDIPPAINDSVMCDVVEHRRTGQSIVENMVMIQRHVPEVTNTGIEATGIVKDIMPNRDFGFISVSDGSGGSNSEMLPFQLSTIIYEGNTNNSKTNRIRNGDSVRFTIGHDTKNGKHVALNVTLIDNNNSIKQKSSNSGKSAAADLNPCKGIVLLKLAKNSFLKIDSSSTPSSKKKESATAAPVPERKSRWENVTSSKDDDRQQEITELGCILLTEDTTGLYSRKTVHPEPSKVVAISDNENNAPPTVPSSVTDSNATTEANETAASQGCAVDSRTDKKGQELDGQNSVAKSESAIMSHLYFKRSAFVVHGGGGSGDEAAYPQRGDLVSFNKTRNGNGVRDIRIVQSGAATVVRGQVESVNLEAGKAEFAFDETAASVDGDVESKSKTIKYTVGIKEIVSCEPAQLKAGEDVEAILFENQVFGICRLSDLYVENSFKSNIIVPTPSSSKSNIKNQQRPKLNLTVKKDRGGTIMAQSMMAKGPDGKTKGFNPGWTKRLSAFAPEFTVPGTG